MLGDALIWWILLIVLGHAGAPLFRPAFEPIPGATALVRPASLAAFTLLAWLLGHAGLSRTPSLALAFLLLAGAGLLMKGREAIGPVTDARARLAREGVFLGAYAFFVLVRGTRPDIFGAEKFMDFAFLNALVRAETFPPTDPWLSGHPFNYYYFGHLLFANLVRLSGIAPEVAYHLSLATIAAVLVSGAAALGEALTRRLIGGLLGAFLTAVAGNLDGAIQLVEGSGIAGFDYWRSSRIVPDTINEFPFFSFLHGDLHPHVLSLFFWPAVLGVALSAVQEAGTGLRTVHVAALVVLLTAVALTNPWDVPLAVATPAAILFFGRNASFARLFPALAVVLAGVAVLSSPFWLHFESPVGGIGRVQAQTAVPAFLTVFGVLLLPGAVHLLWPALQNLPRESDRRDFVVLAGITAVLLVYVVTLSAVLAGVTGLAALALRRLLASGGDASSRSALAVFLVAVGALGACEIVYLQDAYGERLHRMNTVFKVYFQSWVVLGVVFPALLQGALRHGSRRWLLLATLIPAVSVGIAASAVYPAATLLQGLRDPAPWTLDGLADLRRTRPDEYAAIDWLRRTVRDRPVVLEATGPPYSYFARVSSHTGLPTVLGWRNHEELWRGADPRIARRADDVERIYSTTDGDQALELLRSYDVRFIFVGTLEREHYPPAGLRKFAERPFAERFRSGEVVVYEVPARARARPEISGGMSHTGN